MPHRLIERGQHFRVGVKERVDRVAGKLMHVAGGLRPRRRRVRGTGQKSDFAEILARPKPAQVQDTT